ncbi:16026_t:CDS:1 [Entrophospora sp. SA101]|nr:6310_t:CDS:1 [Entrophospora sp. SA101]CAJ0767668.1 16026_t:CDS:1 [Entrophospora sp. SA101]CAJ0843914.1 6188_t:CDS:1 [Entrophospora sp. SA101]CAJ0876522.1 616_t:CDS:1 [Entrophospora sp. SA101]
MEQTNQNQETNQNTQENQQITFQPKEYKEMKNLKYKLMMKQIEKEEKEKEIVQKKEIFQEKKKELREVGQQILELTNRQEGLIHKLRKLENENNWERKGTFRCSNCGETTHAYANCPKVRCGECGELGHIKKFCKNKKCNKCGELGHIRKDCYNYTTKEIMIARKESEENHDTKFTPTEN